MINFDG